MSSNPVLERVYRDLEAVIRTENERAIESLKRQHAEERQQVEKNAARKAEALMKSYQEQCREHFARAQKAWQEQFQKIESALNARIHSLTSERDETARERDSLREQIERLKQSDSSSRLLAESLQQKLAEEGANRKLAEMLKQRLVDTEAQLEEQKKKVEALTQTAKAVSAESAVAMKEAVAKAEQKAWQYYMDAQKLRQENQETMEAAVQRVRSEAQLERERLMREARAHDDARKQAMHALEQARAEIQRLKTVYPLQDMLNVRSSEITRIKAYMANLPENHSERSRYQEYLAQLEAQQDKLKTVLTHSEAQVPAAAIPPAPPKSPMPV